MNNQVAPRPKVLLGGLPLIEVEALGVNGNALKNFFELKENYQKKILLQKQQKEEEKQKTGENKAAANTRKLARR